MNIFVLSTGRCGSMTFSKACQHITNYSSAHESRLPFIGDKRLAYPDNHIEADNRLCWILGRLEQAYGDDAFYVHLTRERQQVAESYTRRHDFGIMKAYREGILLGGEQSQTDLAIAQDYIDTIETNIHFFLKDKTHTMPFQLENARHDFKVFWEWIGAEGNINKALDEWDIKYNPSKT